MTPLTEAQIAAARRMHFKEGKSFAVIATRFLCTPETIRTHLDPVYAKKRRDAKRASDRRHHAKQREQRLADPVLHPRVLHGGPTKREWQNRVAEIPDDTRDLTARVFGDPLPGRSALDRRMADAT